jgi:hypothetical protein
MTFSVTLKTIIFTLVEAGTLAAWLALVSVNQYIGIGTLFVGLVAEHVFSYNTRNARPFFDFSGLPVVGLAVVAAIETVSWAGWLALIPTNEVLAFGFLFATLLVGHGLELNLVRGLPLLTKYPHRLKKSLDITGIESVIGTAWRFLVVGGQAAFGVGVLAVGLFVEHVISARKVL